MSLLLFLMYKRMLMGFVHLLWLQTNFPESHFCLIPLVLEPFQTLFQVLHTHNSSIQHKRLIIHLHNGNSPALCWSCSIDALKGVTRQEDEGNCSLLILQAKKEGNKRYRKRIANKLRKRWKKNNGHGQKRRMGTYDSWFYESINCTWTIGLSVTLGTVPQIEGEHESADLTFLL